MFCKMCGKENSDNNIFCIYCGAKLEENSEDTHLLKPAEEKELRMDEAGAEDEINADGAENTWETADTDSSLRRIHNPADKIKKIGKKKGFVGISILALVVLFAAFLVMKAVDNSKYDYDVKEDGTIAISGYAGSNKRVTIPGNIDGYKVTEIGMFAFDSCSSLQEIEIPSSVTEIGEYAFNECSNLQEIEIPGSVTEIENGAFWGCSSLQEIGIPGSVTKIGNGAFLECSSLQEVEIPPSVTEIGMGAFDDCGAELNLIVSRDSYAEQWAQEQGMNYVYGDENAQAEGTAANMADGQYNYYVKEDGTIAISGYNGSNESLTIPDNIDGYKVTEIGDGAFGDCSSLQEVEIPSSVTKIGEDAFSGCISLQKVEIPGSVTEIGESVFNGCSSLQEIEISDGITEIGNFAFMDCISLQEIKIPPSVTEIGEYAFWACSSLQKIEIPSSVTEIGEGAFWNCSSLQEVEMSSSITEIGVDAFAGCSAELNLIVSRDSYAEQWAQEQGMNYVYGDENAQTKGAVADSEEFLDHNLYNETIAAYMDTYGGDYVSYALYDLDKDGVLELLLSYGTCTADWQNDVYTIRNGVSVYVGMFYSAVSLYEAEDGNGIYAVYGRQGYESLTRITMVNDSIQEEYLTEREVGAGDYYSNNWPIEWKSIWEYYAD